MAVLTGILIFVLGIIHMIYGESVQIPALMKHLDDPVIIGSTRVMIYQGGVILLGVGALQFLKGIGRVRLHGHGALVPVGIIVLNIATFIIVGMVSGPEVIRTALPQLVIFLVIIVMMLIELKRSPETGKVGD